MNANSNQDQRHSDKESLPYPSTIVDELAEQAEELCQIRGHLTPVIANLDIDEDWFANYNEPSRAVYDLEGVVQMFIYQHANGISEGELMRQLRGAAYVYVRFGFPRPLTQQAINYNWRHRFSPTERRTIKEASQRIREICSAHNLMGATEPALDPDDIQGQDIEEDQIMEAVKLATKLGFGEFSADRAENAKYELEAYFERQGYLNLASAGTTTPRRRFARLSEREEVPHGSSHNRTMKKVADPVRQTTIGDYEGARKPPDWKLSTSQSNLATPSWS